MAVGFSRSGNLQVWDGKQWASGPMPGPSNAPPPRPAPAGESRNFWSTWRESFRGVPSTAEKRSSEGHPGALAGGLKCPLVAVSVLIRALHLQARRLERRE